MPRTKAPTKPTFPSPPYVGHTSAPGASTSASSADRRATCVCKPVGESPTTALPEFVAQSSGPTFALPPQREARRLIEKAAWTRPPSVAENVASDHLLTIPESSTIEPALRFMAPAPPQFGERGEEARCKEQDLPCLDPDFLESPGYITDQRAPGLDPEFVEDERGDGPPCDPAAPEGRKIDEEVKKLSTEGEEISLTTEGKKSARKDREEAARKLAKWATDFPEVANRIKREVIHWKQDERNRFHNGGLELMRLERWARETSAEETARVEGGLERGEPGPVLGEVGLILAVDPSQVRQRSELEARAEKFLKAATIQELRDAILHLRKRLEQFRKVDPKGIGKDPRIVCIRGVKTTFDAGLVKNFIRRMLKELLDRLEKHAIDARTLKPKDTARFPFSFEDMREPGVSAKVLEFRDFLDFAKGGFEDFLGWDSAASGLIDAIENSALDVPDSWTDQEISKDIFNRLQELRR